MTTYRVARTGPPRVGHKDIAIPTKTGFNELECDNGLSKVLSFLLVNIAFCN
jgi:hypothetical protein